MSSRKRCCCPLENKESAQKSNSSRLGEDSKEPKSTRAEEIEKNLAPPLKKKYQPLNATHTTTPVGIA
jgi:hypothetical protein